MRKEEINIGDLVLWTKRPDLYWQIDDKDSYGFPTIINHEFGLWDTPDPRELTKYADKPQRWCSTHGPTCHYGCIR